MRFLLPAALSTIALLLTASCSPIIDQRGHSAEQTDYSQIVIGQSRSDDVASILGSPSAESTFGGKTWYYIMERRETVGMLAPEVVDHQVTAIRFDDDDVVSDISKLDKDKAEPVEYVEKTTPTEGRKVTVMEQLLGNFGKFNAPGREIDPRQMGH
jgi:outer membrane protein assembly factor BamE (lipoprotein component of BamABCDE complex)